MFTLIKFLRNKFTRRATIADLGKRVAVLWNPQGVRDFGEKPNWREGVIDYVAPCGGFNIDLDGATMICSATFYGQRKNPFRNLKEL
jgi:hypothetical protein